MRRFFRYLLLTVIGGIVAFLALVWEGSTLESVVFPTGDIPIIDFATLQRTPVPNQYLLCPAGLCTTQTDGEAPVYDMTVGQLQTAWDAMIAGQPRVQLQRRDVANMQVDYVQRSRLLHFPDIITVRFVPVDDTHTTLAIYSRSVYGRGDMGVNRARIDGWLAKLKAQAG